MKKREINVTISWILKAGVIASAGLLLAGMIISYSGIEGALRYSAILESFGIFALFATPVARVATSVASFILERNKIYAVITAIVLMNILIAIFVIPAILHI